MIIDTIALTRGLKVIFNKALATFPLNESLMKVATTILSTGKSETYGWFGDLALMREWLGQKKAKGIKDYSYTLTNQDWENTIEIDRNELADDQTGMIAPRIQMLARTAQEHNLDIISDLIINGTSNTAYDDVAFFSNAAGDRVIDNLLAGSGITLANLETDLTTARATMMKFYFDHSDRKFGYKLDTIVCPPELEILFMKIARSSASPASSNPGVINPFTSIIKTVIVDPRLSDADDWYGFASTYPIKPLIFQDRKSLELTSQAKGSESDFDSRKYKYSVESRNTAGYGFPQMAVKIVN